MEQLSSKQYVIMWLQFSPRNQHPSKKNCHIFVLLKSSHFLRTEKYRCQGDRPGHDLLGRESMACLSMSTWAP